MLVNNSFSCPPPQSCLHYVGADFVCVSNVWCGAVCVLASVQSRGNVIKVDRHKYVKVAYHGFRQLTSEERKQGGRGKHTHVILFIYKSCMFETVAGGCC